MVHRKVKEEFIAIDDIATFAIWAVWYEKSGFLSVIIVGIIGFSILDSSICQLGLIYEKMLGY